MAQNRRVVITGIGTINPLGHNVEEFFKALEEGVSGVDFIKSFDASANKTKFAAEIKNYNPEDYFERKEVRKLDPFTQYALIAADEAIKDAGLEEMEGLDKNRVGVVWGDGIGGVSTLYDEVAAFCKSDSTAPRFSPFMVLRMLPNMAAGHISLKYGYRGVGYAAVSACSSSTHSIIGAVDQIRLGRADVMITGGSEGAVAFVGISAFNSMMALSTRNDDPKRASRPYDKSRDGFVMGEGGAALVVEELEHAKARGAKIYAEIVGSGASTDAYHVTAPDPEGMGAQLCMEAALAEAGIAPEDIDYINTHGTSTPLGDLAEIKGIQAVFGDHAYKLNISSTKSMTGHLLGAAGAVEVLAMVLAVSRGIVPPTINIEELDPAIDERINLTRDVAQRRDVRYALSNNFGFGGQNATIVIKRYEE
ncbi:MAG: beta-ketoacyl-ACP synthase II [Tidjanibacter sp.]|nr:beta-ketoacyl-ACP synthase II [Tidjanibacter sp.]